MDDHLKIAVMYAPALGLYIASSYEYPVTRMAPKPREAIARVEQRIANFPTKDKFRTVL